MVIRELAHLCLQSIEVLSNHRDFAARLKIVLRLYCKSQVSHLVSVLNLPQKIAFIGLIQMTRSSRIAL
jgi:hypothetical protein